MDNVKSPSKLLVLRDLLVKNKGIMASVLPKYLTPDRMTAIALSAVSRSQELQKCTVESICKSVIAAAQLGLEAGSPLGLAYLVPFWNSKINGFEAQMILGYKGIIHLALNNGNAVSFEARAVHEKDSFEYGFGTNPYINHLPAKGDRGNLIYVYAVVKTDKNATIIDVMDRDEVEKIKNRTKSRDRDKKIVGPWITDYEAMAKKTVCKRMQPYLNLSPKIETLLEEEETGIEIPGDVIDMGTGEILDTQSAPEQLPAGQSEPKRKSEAATQERDVMNDIRQEAGSR